MQILDIQHQWVSVESEPGKKYQYPNPLTSHIKENYSGVFVYRWAFYNCGKGMPYMVYVGEAENLARRIGDYLHPGSKRTAKRIKVRLDEERRKGSLIQLDAFRFEPFSILIDRATDTYDLISVDRLSNPFIRKMMENIGVIVHDARYVEILNKASNQMERRRGKALKLTKAVQAMTPEERASYYAKFDLKGS